MIQATPVPATLVSRARDRYPGCAAVDRAIITARWGRTTRHAITQREASWGVGSIVFRAWTAWPLHISTSVLTAGRLVAFHPCAQPAAATKPRPPILRRQQRDSGLACRGFPHVRPILRYIIIRHGSETAGSRGSHARVPPRPGTRDPRGQLTGGPVEMRCGERWGSDMASETVQRVETVEVEPVGHMIASGFLEERIACRRGGWCPGRAGVAVA
jgi:hypothetical protein